MTLVSVLLGFLITIMLWHPGYHGFPLAFSLKRAFPMSPQADMRPFLHRDLIRHTMTLQSPPSSKGVISYRLNGSIRLGMYLVRIRLGSPPMDFNVQVDTGSDVLWVACSPDISALSPSAFNPKNSSTARIVNCTDEMCLVGQRPGESFCSSDDHLCSYKLDYADQSSSSGYFVSDVLHFHSSSGMVKDTAPIVFGCTMEAVANTNMNNYDGILGLGRNSLSIVSQLASQRIAPKAFSLCLSGDEEGGGTLVLGAIRRPDMVYTPIVRSEVNYQVSLKSIYVNGHPVPIDPTVLATSGHNGTVLDSGTTLSYLAEKAYDPFVQAVTAAITPTAQSFISGSRQCYSTSSSVNFDVFPQVGFNFKGGASLLLSPEEYLLREDSTDGAATSWCLQFWKADQLPGITIFGDLLLKNKLFVYDLGAQRVGWVNYNCSMPLNISMVDTGNGRNQYGVASPSTLLSCLMVLSVLLL